MADRRTTLLQCSLRIRRRRKWKKRWCSLTKHSPVSDQVILRFFKSQDAVELGKEISREQISISAQNFCGISLAYRYSKNPYVLTVICLDLVVLLSFDSHGELLNWYHKIQNTLPSATAFQTPVIVPNQPSKINPGRALLHFYDNHFALTPEIPKEVINSWSLSALQKYTFVGDSIFFSSTTSKGEKTFVLVTKDTTVAENLKNHFDLATSVQPTRERLPYINDSGFQQFLPKCDVSLSSSSSNNVGGRYNYRSQNGGPFVHKRNQDEYGVQALQPVNCGIFRANSCCSEHGSQSSFGTRRQFEELRGRANSHDSSNEPSIYDPLLQQHHQPTSSSHQQNCIPMQDILSHISQNSIVPAANGDNDFGFWKPSHSQDETTFTYECTGGSDPSAPPVREQNYEVMNLFDHIRQSHDHLDSSGPTQHCQHTRCSKCQGISALQLADRRQVQEEEEVSKEETSYMNLFTRRADRQVPKSVPLTPLYIPDDAHIHSGNSPTLSDNSYFFLPATQKINHCKRELPSPVSIPAAMVPVPFDHDSLVKPSGPIAMLNSPACIVPGDGAITSGNVKSKEVKVTRSASGPPGMDEAGPLVAVCHRERQNSFPTQNGLRTHRKYSMPPVSGNLLADTRQDSCGYHSDDLPPELPPRIPPRDFPLPSPPASSYIRQRCYTDSAYAMKEDSEHRYLMMKPAPKERPNMMTLRSKTIASSPLDVAIPTSPLGAASRVYNAHYMGGRDRRNVSPSLIRSASGRVDPNVRLLKRSATVATNLTRKGRDGALTISARRGSMPSPVGSGSHSYPHRSHSVASHAPRPRTSRDYASINPELIAQKQGSLSCRSSRDNILSSDHSATYSDTSGSGVDATPSSSSLSDLSSQATSSRASSFGSQSGVGLLYQRGSLTNNPIDDINQNR